MAWLYRQNKSQYWWIGYRINGRQYLRSTRETDRAEAEKLLAQFGTIQEANRAGRLTEEFYLALTQQSPRVVPYRVLPDKIKAAGGKIWSLPPLKIIQVRKTRAIGVDLEHRPLRMSPLM